MCVVFNTHYFQGSNKAYFYSLAAHFSVVFFFVVVSRVENISFSVVP